MQRHPAASRSGVMGLAVTSPACAMSVPTATELTNKSNMASLQCDADDVNLEELMVQDLVDLGVTKIPTKFVRPVHERSVPEAHRTEYFRAQPEIPVIDMAPLLLELAAVELDHPEAVKEKQLSLRADIARACEDWGFFQVVNHGVPESLMDAAMEMNQKFHALSAEEKAVYKVKDRCSVGYGRLFEVEGALADWVDRMNWWSQPDELKEAEPMLITNPPGMQAMIDEYGKAVYALALKLMAILSEQIGQPSEFLFSKMGGRKAGLRTYIINYPPCPQPDLTMGISKHSDISAISVLQQNNVSALEVERDGRWVNVPPDPHAFVINVGDALQMTSNDRFKSSIHRAVATRGGRFTIGNFLFPAEDAAIGPAPELCSDTQPALYCPVKFHDFLNDFTVAPLGGARFMHRYKV